MPKRLMSKLAAPVAIISMAQHARPKVAGHTLLRRAHLTRSSRLPVRKLWLRSSSPMPVLASSGRRARPADATDGGLAGAVGGHRGHGTQALGRAPVEGAVADEVDERHEHGHGEHDHLDQAE